MPIQAITRSGVDASPGRDSLGPEHVPWSRPTRSGPRGLYRDLILAPDGIACVSRGDRTRTCNPRFWRPVLCQIELLPCVARECRRVPLHGHTMPEMKSHTVYLSFRTEQRREFVRITEDVAEAVSEAGITEGMVLVAAMHITAAVWINDDERGLQADVLEWLDKVAPPSWKEPENEVARELLPDPGDYRHHRGGEDNGDAHLKNLLVHHQVVVPVTDGQLDLGPWQQIFYCEFDGRRSKRLVIKVMGE
jgi:thiamine phosphate synthase YjbQ (UPF0047 family)